MSREHGVTLTRVFRAERAIVWAIVADTNRWDRAAGLKPPRYTWSVIDGARVRVGEARELGLELRFVERPYRFVEGRMLEGERRFVSGPVEAGGFTVTLDDVPEGTRATARAWVRAPFWVGVPQRFKFARALPRYLDAIAALLAPLEGKPMPGTPEEPAVARARRLVEARFDVVTSGPRSAVVEDELMRRLGRLAMPDAANAHCTPLAAALRELSDDDVASMRPFELARRWDASPREVLRTFLYATEAGVLDMRWQINCPVCRVGASRVARMADIAGAAHCDACDIDYGVDFARHVEAVFAPNPAVRRATPALYCASSPAFLPHVLAQLRAHARGTETHALDLVPGRYHVRVLGSPRSADVVIDDARAQLAVRITAEALVVSASAHAGETASIVIANETDREEVVLVERTTWSADAALGTTVATFPEFARLFATEAPAAGVELAIGEVALLFSDLTGSTALYERIGDARAFALVEAHFKAMTEVVHAHGGAVIKTMGDAVMASFPTLEEAVRGGLAMVEAHERAFAEHALHVKLGVHAGPALVVRANDRFDFFGTTVNVAARLQAQARSGELVLLEAATAHPAIAPLLAARPRRTFTASLKGIAEAQALVGIDVLGA